MGSRDYRYHNRQAKKHAGTKRRLALKYVESAREARSAKIDTSGQADLLPCAVITHDYTCMSKERNLRIKRRGTYVRGKDKRTFKDF